MATSEGRLPQNRVHLRHQRPRGGICGWTSAGLLSLDQGRHYDIPELHRPVIALQHNRPGLSFMRVDCDRGEAFHLSPIDNLLPVKNDGDLPPHQPDIVGLPFAGGPAGILAGENAGIECAVAVRVGRTAVVIEDLDFIPAAQPDATVGVRGELEFRVQNEIPEFAVRGNILALAGSRERAVSDGPPATCVGAVVFQPVRSLPLNSTTGLPLRQEPSSLSVISGAGTPTQVTGG